jgi:hypothetical protein
MRPYWQAHETWETEANAALLEGREPPAEPEPPKVSDADQWAAHSFLAERRKLDDERKRTLVAIADDVERDATAAIDETLTRHRRAAQSIAEAHEHVAALLADVSIVRRAVDPQHAETVTASRSDVIAACLGERPLLSPERTEDLGRQGIVQSASTEGYDESQPHASACGGRGRLPR